MSTQDNKKDKKSIVNNLVKQTAPTAAAIKAAQELYNKEQEEATSRRILRELEQIDDRINRQVQIVRNYRAEAKKVSKQLLKLAEAKEMYLADANFEKFKIAVKAFGIYM